MHRNICIIQPRQTAQDDQESTSKKIPDIADSPQPEKERKTHSGMIYDPSGDKNYPQYDIPEAPAGLHFQYKIHSSSPVIIQNYTFMIHFINPFLCQNLQFGNNLSGYHIAKCYVKRANCYKNKIRQKWLPVLAHRTIPFSMFNEK